MTELKDNLKGVADGTPLVLEGVFTGFLMMAIPVFSIGVVVGLSLLLFKTPLRTLSEAGGGN